MRGAKVLGSLALVCLMAGNVLAQSGKKSDGDQDKITPKAMAGTWTIIKGMKAGEESDAEMLAMAAVSISETAFSMPSGAGEDFVMEFSVDNSKSPAHIDMTLTAGPAPESTALGIVGMKDGKLMLCYNPMGADRPEKFESTAENGFFMFVMEPRAMDAADIVGTWAYHSGMRAGQESPAERLQGNVTISETDFTVPAGPEGNFVMEYKLDTSESPAAIDLEIKEGPVPEGTALGIIKMDGDNVVFCYDPTGANRPTAFESTEDNGFFLFVLKPADE